VCRAAGLMATSRTPVQEIARQCGFADQAHLTRTFKMHFGVSPARYRRGARRVR
jgi:AraC-like DNA-binding protein